MWAYVLFIKSKVILLRRCERWTLWKYTFLYLLIPLLIHLFLFLMSDLFHFKIKKTKGIEWVGEVNELRSRLTFYFHSPPFPLYSILTFIHVSPYYPFDFWQLLWRLRRGTLHYCFHFPPWRNKEANASYDVEWNAWMQAHPPHPSICSPFPEKYNSPFFICKKFGGLHFFVWETM